MKRNIFITVLLVLVLSVAAKAQSTYLLPWRGATHTYTATVSDPTNNNPVRWYVTTNVAGTVKAVNGTDYTFITAGYNAVADQLEGVAVYSVQIRWGVAVAEATNFYVFLEVDDDVSSCTNRMAVHVQIAADFNAVAYDVTGSATPGTVDPNSPTEDVLEETCPDDVQSAVWNGTGHTDIGYSEILFRVDRELSIQAWQFQYTISEGTLPASLPFVAENIRMVDESGTELYNGTNLTGTINVGSTKDYVLVYVQITNQMGVTLNMEMNLITSSSNTKDADNKLDSNLADNKADHVIKPMPVISGFGGH